MSENKHRVLPESEGNILCAEIGQKVSLHDYEAIFEPAVGKLLSEYKDVKVLLSYTRPFLGWDLDAAAKDLAVMTKVGQSVKKVALIDPPDQVVNRWSILKPLLGGEVRFFKQGEYWQALDWLKA